jgi:hypothetical protein
MFNNLKNKKGERKMKQNEKKEELIKQLNKVNFEYHDKVLEHDPMEDCIGDEKQIIFDALRYVPNHVLKKWTSRLKKEIKKV